MAHRFLTQEPFEKSPLDGFKQKPILIFCPILTTGGFGDFSQAGHG